MKTLSVIVMQIVALVAISQAGYAVAAALQLPVPGNLVGMLFLLGLLATGLVRLTWIETSASLLTRHLAFFFIPLTVGLLGFVELFLDNGPAILAVLIVSAGIGIGVAGLSSQRLASRKGRKTE
ncbi:MAG: CidA/LrgA family protein [Candidatus Rokuibacteriota bacterium]